MGARSPLLAVVVVASALSPLGASCGSSDGVTSGGAVATPTTPSTPPPSAITTTTVPLTTIGETSSTITTTTTTEPAPATTTTLPGEPYEYATAGAVAHVAGVAFDERFDLSVMPGHDQPVAAALPPLTELMLTGRGRQIDQGSFSEVWFEVTAGELTGWIAQWSVVYLGGSRDITDEAAAAIGHWPAASTMLELGQLITDAIVQPDPEFPPGEIVLVGEPTVGSEPDSVYDGFPGEAFASDVDIGSRYWIVGRKAASGSYKMVSVEVASLCTRGVDTATGYCV